ncbi:MAG: PASTA domain-containing protein, partial [Desulfurivibrionaceae bacterium]
GDELLSPEFKGWRQAAVVGEQQSALLGDLGLFGKSGIDLPETAAGSQETGRTTPLNLLSAFAVLVNGGREITPYVGEAVIDPASGRRTSIARPEPHGQLIGERTSRKIVGLLAEASRSGPERIFLESMRPTGTLNEAREGAEESVEKPEPGFQTVLIGFTPGQDGVALLVALDRAVVDADKKTLMRNLGEEVIGRMAALAAEQVDPPSPEAMAAGEKRIFETWLGSRAYDHLVAAAVNVDSEVKRPDVMPDLHGLSLRKGLRVLQTFGVKVRVVGSGRIVEQEPAAGAIFDGGECRLSLRSDL